MNQARFKQECFKQFVALFTNMKGHQFDENIKFRVQGFVAAGEFMKVISRDEGLAIMESAHRQVFGESIAGQQAHKRTKISVYSDYEEGYFDLHPSQRD